MWWWSEALFAIHALTPGETLLTTKLILAHKHPDDAGVAEAAIRAVTEDGGPFSLRHRIVTAQGEVRQVISVGRGVHVEDRVAVVHGFMLDVTESSGPVVEDEAWKEASRIIEHRAAIERAKGALMAVYGIGSDEAFALLRGVSNRKNLKLREVAVRLLDGLPSKDFGGYRTAAESGPDLLAALRETEPTT